LLLQKDPKIRPKAARIHTLPLSELKMPNYAVLTYDDGEEFEGQFKDNKFSGFRIF
jgi:hypothetical protein